MSEHDEHKDAEHVEHDFTGPLSPPVKRLIRALLAICAVLVGADLFVHRHVEAPLEGLPGFYAAYGFIGCAILVLAAKEMRKVVMRPEDYYDPEVPTQGTPTQGTTTRGDDEGGDGR